MTMFTQSIIGKSRQTWKLQASFAGLLSGFLLVAVALHGEHAVKNGGLLLAGISLDVLTIVAASLGVRCRACGARWLWSAVRYQHSSA